MFCLFQLDPASYKDGFHNPDHVWTSCEVLVFLTAQGDWKDYDTSFSCSMLRAQFTYMFIDIFKLPFIHFSVEHYTVLYLIV